MSTPSKTDEVLATILTKSLETAEKTGQFIKEQLPDVVQQLIAWNTANCVMWITVTVVALASYAGIWKKLSKIAKSKDAYDEFHNGFLSFKIIGGIISLVVAVPVLLINISKLLKLAIAPKVWLLEYTAHLLRSI